MISSSLLVDLLDCLSHLLHERFQSHPQRARRHVASLRRSEAYEQFQVLHQLLCQQPPEPPLPSGISNAINRLLSYQRENKILTSATSIPPRITVERTRLDAGSSSSKPPINLRLWRGDITTLTNVTAIVNAANSELLGCFQPTHKCIDNIIHSAAGPVLRQEMSRIMKSQDHAEPVGQAKISSGFNLPVKHIIHTVGPSIAHSTQAPSEREREQLASCYRSCLDAAATLPPDKNGRLSIAFCCISTGLFAFPKPLAASVAIETVLAWCEKHPFTPITDIIFDVWTEEDLVLYNTTFGTQSNPPLPNTTSLTPHHIPPSSLLKAKQWIQKSDALLLTAGAGLSAAAGLDYTSTALFNKHYPAYAPLGLTRLYDTIGFAAWPSELTKWGYYFLHADLVRRWPSSPIYQSLLDLVRTFEVDGEQKWWVKTSNADGLLARHGFEKSRISTPQGQYAYLQCFAKCRPNAVFPTANYLDAALPFIDPKTQSLTDPALVPKCEFCGGEMTLCVRGGGYFNESKFEEQEDAYHDFINEIIESEKNLVILELGVGMNTAGVLRWPNEELVERGEGRIKLVRMGLGPSACAPLEMVEDGNVVVVDGDLGGGVELLTS